MLTAHIAHVRPSDDKNTSDNFQTHKLSDHLQKVATLASRFAGERGAYFAYIAGLLHDLGKFQAYFQEYIRKASGFERENAHIEETGKPNPKRKPHSTAGARYAIEQLQAVEVSLGYMLAYLIAGHHAGLADWYDKGSLKQRLQDADAEFAEALAGFNASDLPPDFLTVHGDKLLQEMGQCLAKSDKPASELHIWLRFWFSCLVDADFLDTESFMQGFPDYDSAKAQDVRPTFPDLPELHARYHAYMAGLSNKTDKTSAVNQERQAILAQCLSMASMDKSLFSLTVPTGGGKTLASLGFALEHALKFGKKRIIYAIPFTSIIEQNADVFRKVLGDDVVLEHHSSLDVKEDKETAKTRLATENWDAPLIVTTNVQLFESLHSARTSRCRKIHNIADSVIILDEAQQIPRDFSEPITDVMRVLARDFGVTFVLCTATQPELGADIDVFGRELMQGLPDIQEIIKDKDELANRLQRVTITLPKPDVKHSWQEIADEIAKRACVLAVVNTRKHARLLYDALPTHGIKLHLSANMCATHRTEVIALIRHYLEQYRAGVLDVPLWVVSTQLIEAGVDLDFPCVYRAMAGLDSIAQSAGRCNREGKMPTLGEVIVFRAEQNAPSGSLRQGQDITEEMLSLGLLDKPLSPKAFGEYFKRFNGKGDRDKHGITQLLTPASSKENPLAIAFRTASDRFRLIDNVGVALVVPFVPLVWGDVVDKGQAKTVPTNKLGDFFAQVLKDQAPATWQDYLNENYRHQSSQGKSEHASFDGQMAASLPEPFEAWFTLLESDPLKYKWVYRQLQRYTINVYEHELAKLPKGAVFERAGLLVLDVGYYDKVLGADFDDKVLPPEASVL